jgi:serine/threonine-protein kinase
MTESVQLCSGCNQKLSPQDHICPRCGTPASGGVDADATVIDPARAEKSNEVTEPNAAPKSKARLSGAEFNDQFRQIISDEYEILSLIGQGGFARVYKARDLRLDRVVAIKVIRPNLVGTDLYMESFRNEGIALAKLRHPGIVPIYDIREQGGLIYYIMPFVEGTTLESRLNRAKLPPYESRRILCELTDALAAAHRAKMVHLDIKPENVFLEGDLQKVLLMDFGIATAISDQIQESSGGPVVGTPAYMSPEQARGLPDIDHRSDIYSLGALGYRMLMGRPPFSGRDGNEVLEKHVKQAPVPIRDVNPTIPKDFADAIMKCLEKDPWERFSTAKELETALQAVTFSTTRRSTRGESAPRDTSVGVEGMTLAVIVVVALTIGLLIGLAIS